MDVLRTPVEVAAKGSCHAKGCKKYTCWYHIFGK
jgi:hypothetical protein